MIFSQNPISLNHLIRYPLVLILLPTLLHQNPAILILVCPDLISSLTFSLSNTSNFNQSKPLCYYTQPKISLIYSYQLRYIGESPLLPSRASCLAKDWSMVTFARLFSSSEIQWSDNILVTILGMKVTHIPWLYHQFFKFLTSG